MGNQKLNKRIDIVRDERSHIWSSFLVTISASLALIIQGGYNVISLIGFAGLILSLFLFVSYFKRSVELDCLIKKIKEKED